MIEIVLSLKFVNHVPFTAIRNFKDRTGGLSVPRNIILTGMAVYLVLTYDLGVDRFVVGDTLAWVHATLEYEQKAKLSYIIDMGWLNLAEHNV